jgi:hypothetical protein
MPTAKRTTTGVGTDVTVPQPYRIPEIPEEFHYETSGDSAGYLVWKRQLEGDMAGGSYEVYRATTYNGTYSNIATVSNPASGKWVSHIDQTAPPVAWWKIRAKSVNGNYSDFTLPVLFLQSTDLCEVIVGLEDMGMGGFQEGTFVAYPETTADYVVWKYRILPKPKTAASLDVGAKGFVLKLIPSAEIGGLKYTFLLITPEKKISFTGITVPSESSKYFTDLLT